MENKIHEKGTLGWLREHAKIDGFDNIRDWQNWKIKRKNNKILDKKLKDIRIKE